MNTILQERLSIVFAFFKTNLLYFLIAAVLLGVIVIGVQRHFDRRAIERQTEATKKYEEEMAVNRAKNAEMIEIFNRTNTATNNILSAMKAMDGTLTELVENDRQREIEAANLRIEYKNARTQTNNPKNQTSQRNSRADVPLRQRELDALRADDELYPGTKTN